MTEAYPLHWPEGWPRTPAADREAGYQFTVRPAGTTGGSRPVTFAVARDKLYDALRLLGAAGPVVSTNHPADRYGVPTESKRRVADEGVAVYFALNGRPTAMACDRYDTAAANMRSLGLAIEAMGQLRRHGGGVMAERAFRGFAALPPPPGDDPRPGPRSPWDVLGVAVGATAAEVDAAFRERAKAVHPDRGGSAERMRELTEARAAAKAAAAR